MLANAKFYKVKNPKTSFLCALCRAPRQMRRSKNLSIKNYLQLLVLAVFIGWLCFPLMGLKSLYLLFVLWPMVEMTNKILYRKEIPCPYCGFDATWYRRDVKVARRKVEEFWNINHPEHVQKKEEIVEVLDKAQITNEAAAEENNDQA
ncbi:MAG: hypothetical protein WEB87_07100 [Bacteriovoracaceae bacterium]